MGVTMKTELEQATVGEIVAADFRAANVFERFGIDFCCGGRRSVADACRTADADPDAVVKALDALEHAVHEHTDFASWPAARLVDHIVTVHHDYVRRTIPEIQRHLAKLVAVHGARHLELAHVAAAFDRVAADLLHHMMKEEWILFPYIREIEAHSRPAASSPFGTVANPIRMMEQEHRDAGDEMERIRELTDSYVPPFDACTTYKITFQELADFERDLHLHVHLENNVLFPLALRLERETPAS
jgi:regulator of cell morphogenesis and NO signaling